MTRRRLAAALSIAVVVAALAVVLAGPFRTARSASGNVVPSAWARVVRTDVVERQQVAGTLDYSGSFAVANARGAGVVTWVPAPGAVVRRGRALYALDRTPVRLLYGPQPASRDLTLGIADGGDVRALQQNLRALGFTAHGALRASGRFDLPTLVAVEQWQRALGEPVTGTLPLGRVVFLPTAVRVAAVAAAPGASVQAGASILSATSADPAVLVPLDPGGVSRLAVGDAALVTMPDGTVAHGRVASVGRVASAPSSDSGQGGGAPTVPVTIDLLDAHAGGGLDQAPVQVAVTEQLAPHVLAVPISALLAQPGAGYAVRVPAGNTTRLVPVTTGLFDDVAGRVEVSGPGLTTGLRVQVPRQ